MLVNIENLIAALNSKQDHEKVTQLSHMVIESIATKNDDKIMTDLMIDMLHRNAMLNRSLEEKIKEIEILSVTDQLTGIFNRRKFVEMLSKEINRSTRYDSVYSLIMFDIDHFKRVNDTYGHDVGDFVLKLLSKTIKDMLRQTDVFARWGGEEFMILAPEIDLDNALILAEKIRGVIEATDFSPVPKVTSSFGVLSNSTVGSQSFEYLTKSVDEALYEAKSSGRNRVVSFDSLGKSIDVSQEESAENSNVENDSN